MAELKETIINGKYLLGTKFGSGAFGEIYMGSFITFIMLILLATNTMTNEVLALKLV
jgi:hypothetical protein